MKSFTKIGADLCQWYNREKRNLPWRDTLDPYKIWVSEIILQQTRVAQGIGYYNNFISKFPNVRALALSEENEVLKIWQGLGYYSRARNMHFTAKYLVEKHNGIFPSTYIELTKLKGIGPYTAAAIASIVFDEKVPVVDGNVFRVLSRLFTISEPVNNSLSYKIFAQKATDLMHGHTPGIFNQAIMELGALICKPKQPDCSICPIAHSCMAKQNNMIHLFPVKIEKTLVKHRYFHYLVIRFNNAIVFKKRNQNDIWKGLFDFPLCETDLPLADNDNKFTLLFPKNSSGKALKPIGVIGPYRQKLTHQLIEAWFYEFETSTPYLLNENEILLPLDQIQSIAIPVIIEKYLKNVFGVEK